MTRAVVLLSGGLDSTTTLAVALAERLEVDALCVSYGQRHSAEINAAIAVANRVGVSIHVVSAPALGELAHSALTSSDPVPKDRSDDQMHAGIPSTYVPARNTVLLGLALANAETLGARIIYTGFNVLDASGYPDCRPEFVRAFEALANVAAAPGEPWQIRAPLISMTKAEIITLGTKLGVDYSITHSCYDPVTRIPKAAATKWAKILNTISGQDKVFACDRCDACQLRRKGFVEAGIADPTAYA